MNSNFESYTLCVPKPAPKRHLMKWPIKIKLRENVNTLQGIIRYLTIYWLLIPNILLDMKKISMDY